MRYCYKNKIKFYEKRLLKIIEDLKQIQKKNIEYLHNLKVKRL